PPAPTLSSPTTDHSIHQNHPDHRPPPPPRRHPAHGAIGARTAPDERRIPDPAGIFVQRAACGSSDADRPLLVKSNGSDGISPVRTLMEGIPAGISAFPPDRFPKFLFSRRDQFLRIARGDLVLGGEALGACANKKNMLAFIHHFAG